jgi:hypothetical protein
MKARRRGRAVFRSAKAKHKFFVRTRKISEPEFQGFVAKPPPVQGRTEESGEHREDALAGGPAVGIKF